MSLTGRDPALLPPGSLLLIFALLCIIFEDKLKRVDNEVIPWCDLFQSWDLEAY